MPRGGSRDGRETFVVDTMRLRNKGEVPPAPTKGSFEFYFREFVPYYLDENGIEHPFGVPGFGFSAAPGFTWGRKGNVNSGSWLQNDDVPSNVTGRIVAFTDPTIRKILITNANPAAVFTITIVQHDGVTYTNLTSVPVVGRTAVANVSVPVTSGKQLAIRVTSGQADNPVVGLIMDGEY